MMSRWVKHGYFLTARSKGHVVASISYVPYDNRFAQLSYHDKRVVELGRVYVLPAYRRCGLAAAMFGKLGEHAGKQGVECLYLHTHPFLPGTIGFWEKRGFEVLGVEDDTVWQTTHMQLVIESARHVAR